MSDFKPSRTNNENKDRTEKVTMICEGEKTHPLFCCREDDPPYVKNRLARFINYFFFEKQKTRTKERIYQYMIISLGALIPIVNVLGLETLAVNYLSAIFGGGISVLTTILAFEKYHERWMSFKQAATKLSNEYYLWRDSSGPYAPRRRKKGDDTGKNDEDIEDLDYLTSYEGRLARLVQRCEAIMTSEAFDYVALFSSTNVTTQSTQPPPSESP